MTREDWNVPSNRRLLRWASLACLLCFAFSGAAAAQALHGMLPPGSVTFEGKGEHHWTVSEVDGQLQISPEETADGNLSITFHEGDANATMAHLKTTFGKPLKLTLYISPDGEQWEPTSSCPLRLEHGGFENWPYVIPMFAIARVSLAGDSMNCE